MTDDPLRDAVKRLRSLKEDVERLKSSRRTEGVLRIIRQVGAQLGLSDIVDARLQDRLADEQLGLVDTITARFRDRLADDQIGFGDAVATSVETGGEFYADGSRADSDDRVA